MAAVRDIRWSGFFRIYWNGARDVPRVWSIDCGNNNLELNVKRLYIHKGVTVRSDYMLLNDWPDPKGWLRGYGEVSVTARGVAHIYPRKRKK